MPQDVARLVLGSDFASFCPIFAHLGPTWVKKTCFAFFLLCVKWPERPAFGDQRYGGAAPPNSRTPDSLGSHHSLDVAGPQDVAVQISHRPIVARPSFRPRGLALNPQISRRAPRCGPLGFGQ